MFFIRHLPMAFLSGLKIKAFSEYKAVVTLPFTYLTKNPFRSIYFACQAMAAEFSSAIICLQTIENYETDLSLLVTGLEATFTKKATQKISFTCEKPQEQDELLEQCISSEQAQEITYTSIGRNESGEKVAEFLITWSFKPRT
nr:DUF4442 domain-containing protein [Halalkalibaculum roseum]